MSVLLVDNGTTLLQKLETLIPGDEVVHRWDDLAPSDVVNADLIVLSGSSLMQLRGNERTFQKEIDFISVRKTPLIGICFGCELVTEGFGGSLKRLPIPHKGIRTISVIDSGLFGGKKEISVYENHRWIIDTLPPDFNVLAESEQGPEAIRHRSLPIWGLQFHPENFVDQTEGDDVFMSIMKSVSA